MSEKSTPAVSGISFAGLLTVLFIGLKLAHYIDWSWWWVLAPLWIGWAIMLGLGAVFLLAWLVAAGFIRLHDRRKLSRIDRIRT